MADVQHPARIRPSAIAALEAVGDHTYVIIGTGGEQKRRHVGKKIGGGEALRYLGYRSYGDGTVSWAPYYLVRCKHGTVGAHVSGTFAMIENEAGHHVSLCFRSCGPLNNPRAERICVWCGARDPKARAIGTCRACARSRGRNSAWPCGKPVKAWVMLRPEAEHNCDQCEPWLTPEAGRLAALEAAARG